MAEADAGQQFHHATLALFTVERSMQAQDLLDLRANGFYRIKRVARILRHQADAHAAQSVEAFLRPVGNIFAVQADLSAVAAGIFRHQSDNRLRGGGFTGA